MVAAHVIFAFSNSVTKSFSGSRYEFSLWLNVANVPHLKYFINDTLAGLNEESGATVLKNNGNFVRSLNDGEIEPKETWNKKIFFYKINVKAYMFSFCFH